MRPIYVMGAARSGTTWVQNMLGAHPSIATPQELELFPLYVAPWHEHWRGQLPASEDLWRRHRHKGLPAILNQEAFETLLTDLVGRVYAEVLARKPGATTVLEKEPGHTVYSALLLRHFPEARFVHVIRDGRDVAASLLRASSGWGGTWATATVERAAWIWRTNVEHGRRTSLLTPNYVEVRYETLRSDAGPSELARVFRFAGLDAALEECEEIYRRHTLGLNGNRPASSIVWGGEALRRLGGPPEEPEGFFGPARPGAWRDELSPGERWTFHRVAGDMLVELGYAEDGGWTGVGPARAAAAAARLAVDRAARGIRFAAGGARRGYRDANFYEQEFPFAAGWDGRE